LIIARFSFHHHGAADEDDDVTVIALPIHGMLNCSPSLRNHPQILVAQLRQDRPGRPHDLLELRLRQRYLRPAVASMMASVASIAAN